MDEQDVIALLAAKHKEVAEVSAQVDMAKDALFQVTERTQNFREYFFASRQHSDLTRSAQKQYLSLFAARDVEEHVQGLEDLIQNLRNIVATVLRTVERLDT